jgi:hypothetical protein
MLCMSAIVVCVRFGAMGADRYYFRCTEERPRPTRAASATNTASRLVSETRETASELGDKTAMPATRASSAIQQTVRDEEVRDNILLGAASLAVAAALGISLARRDP